MLYTSGSEQPLYRNLVMEGGGVLQFAYLGALQVLEQRQLLASITNFAGSSAGAMMAGFLACGLTLADIEVVYSSFKLSTIADHSCLLLDLKRLWTSYGLYKGDLLYQWYGQVLQKFTGNADITFRQVLQRYGRTLVITGTNVDQQCTVYFNPNDHPDMTIRQAVRISCSYPFFFQAVQYQGFTWCDGGLLDNFPINYFDTPDTNPNETLGLKLVSSEEYNNHPTPITSFSTYVHSIIQAVSDQAMKVHVREIDWIRTVRINTGSLSSLDFNITATQTAWLKSQGQLAMEGFLQNPCAAPETDSHVPSTP